MVAFLLRRCADDAGSPSNSTGGRLGLRVGPWYRTVGTYPDESPVSVYQEDPVRSRSLHNESSTHYYNTRSSRLEPEYFFFPRIRPSLGDGLRPLPSGWNRGAGSAGADGVCERSFYPVLSTRLRRMIFPARLQFGDRCISAARTELQNELRAKIAELISADGSTQSAGTGVACPGAGSTDRRAGDGPRRGFGDRTSWRRFLRPVAGRGDWN